MNFLKFISLMSACLLLSSCKESTPAKESAYQRVIKSNSIHCGYSQWSPLLYTDPNTNQKAGIFYDLMEEVGKRLSLKIVWQEELGWDTVVQSVNSGRVDMACAGYYLHPDRIKYLSSTLPQIYTPLYIWGRSGDHFNALEDLNNSKYRFAMVDGGSSNELIAKKFPLAQPLSLPGTASNGELIESLKSKKADFFVDDKSGMAAYQSANPGVIDIVFPDKPVTLIPVVMLLPVEDPQLKDMIDSTLLNIEYDGTLDTILKNNKVDQIFLRNPQPQK
jgi:ABC-type amino acid transport substrate-binding protein